jgi:Leucine-rich repeat (LRR) protein
MIIQNVNFPDFQQLPWFIGSMPHLESLALIHLSWLRDIWTLGDCHQLKYLTIAGDKLPSIRPLAGSADLRTLRLFVCSNLESLEGVETLQKLSHLEIDYCTNIRNLTPLNDLKSLRKLRIRGSDIQDLTPLAGLDQLESLALVNMPKLRKITTMGSKALLSDLTIHNCKLVANLKPLLQMEALRACSLHGFKGKQICPVFSLKNMKSLDLSMCTMEDRDLFGVLKLLQLEAVALSGALDPQHLDNIAALVGLRRLELQGCVSLTTLTFLKYMKNLVDLDLTCCWNGGSLDALAHCPALEKLSLSAYNFREMNPAVLECLPRLRELKMAGWAGLKDLSCLKSLLHLEQLDIRHCTSLENIDHLAGLTHLNNITCDPSHLELMTEGLQGLRKLANAESRISYPFIFERTEPFPGSIPHGPDPRINFKMYNDLDELVQNYAKLAGAHFSGGMVAG